MNAEDETKAEERTSIGADVVHEAIRRAGEKELQRTPLALAFSGLAAGLSMGSSLFAEGILRTYLPDTPWRPLITKFGYSLGFLFVILGRQQLFTENTLTPILPLLARRNKETLVKVLRLWAIVLLANLLGSLLFAWAMIRLDFVSPETRLSFLGLGHDALAHPPLAMFLRAILAGWLIAMMVWLLPASDQQLPVIVIVTYVVGLGGLSHIVAGASETLTVLLSGQISFSRWLTGWMLPTLSGNMVGGLLLVAALNHAQVASGVLEPPKVNSDVQAS